MVKSTVAQDMRSIYLAFMKLGEGEELTTRELTEYIDNSVKTKNARLNYCIDKLCFLGMTISEDFRGKNQYYSILKSSVNDDIYNLIYRRLCEWKN